MAKYKLLIKPSAIKELETVPSKKDRKRIVNRIGTLAENPRGPGCEKLSGQADRYRVRQGTYRILYLIHDQELTVEIVKVAHRKDVYR